MWSIFKFLKIPYSDHALHPRPAPAPTAPPASVLAEIRRLEGRVAELRARYCPGQPRPAYVAVRTFAAAPASAQEWGPCTRYTGGGDELYSAFT